MPWLPSWELYQPAENLERQEAEKFPSHLLDSWVIKFVALCGAFSARHEVRKASITGSLCIWFVHSLVVKSSCWQGGRL